MIQDDEIAKSGKGVRKCDEAAVDRLSRRAVGRGNLNSVRGRAADSISPVEPQADGTRSWPVEIAAERAQRQRRRLRRRPARAELAKRDLQLLLCRLQLARQLRVQIAAPVDVPD